MLNFATLFDINYLSRGLALLESIKKHSSTNFRLFVLCLDQETKDFFSNNNYYPEVSTITLSEIETWNSELADAKSNRSIVEYYFTLSPALPLYILEKHSEIPHITTMDADILFFSDPNLIFKDFENHSIQITPHKFTKILFRLEKHGVYNVSFQSFKNDQHGINCLKWWMEKCIEWCYDRYEETRFADQKYLDQFEQLYPGKVRILDHKGAGVAPWNIDQYQISRKGESIYIDNEKLIYYHYHHFRQFNSSLFLTGLREYQAHNTSLKEMKIIYIPYIHALKAYDSNNSDSGIKRIKNASDKSLIKFIINNPSIFFYFNYYICFTFGLGKFGSIIYNIYAKIKKWRTS